MRLIDADALIDALKHDAKVRGIVPFDQGYTPFDAIITINGITDAQSEQRWTPVEKIPPRGKDLMLKIYDKHNLFYYYHMGFHDGEKYYTYNFFWCEDKDLEIVGWQLCPWEGEQE